jgi:hypothetical protein
MIYHEGTKGTKEKALRLSHAVVGAAIEVHRHLGQACWYRLKLTQLPVGLLINFNVELLRHGVRRVLNG